MIHRIIGGINYKPRATRVLKEIVRKTDSLSGGLICGYSITDTENGVFAADAILVSDQGQTTIIDVAEGRELGEYQERQDWGFNLIVGTLQANPRLMEGRRLRVHTRTLTFAPELEVGDETDPEHPVITKKGLIHFLERCQAAQEAGVDPNTVLSEVLMTTHRVEHRKEKGGGFGRYDWVQPCGGIRLTPCCYAFLT